MSYGVQMFAASGALRLDLDETFTRLVHVEYLPPLFTGTFSVPSFDDVGGFFIPNFVTELFLLGSPSTLVPRMNPHAIPNLFWNNTTKIMTVSPHSLPAAWGSGSREYVQDPACSISFYHYG